jgi:hypothetical protein
MFLRNFLIWEFRGETTPKSVPSIIHGWSFLWSRTDSGHGQ